MYIEDLDVKDDLVPYVFFRDEHYIYLVRQVYADKFRTYNHFQQRMMDADLVIAKKARSIVKSRHF